MSVKIIDTSDFVAPQDNLEDWYKCCSKYSQFFTEKYNKYYYDGVNQNLLVQKLFDKYWYTPGSETVTMVLNAQNLMSIKEKLYNCKKVKFTNWWFITLTSKPDWTEIEAKAKIDKYRQARFKDYKYIWVEEHGTNSEKYHQHILVESDKRFHTGQNLKPTKYYDANINIVRVTDTHRSKVDIVKYMTKENQPQGNLTHFGCI